MFLGQSACSRHRGVLSAALIAATSLIFLAADDARAQDWRLYKDYDRYRYLPRLPEQTENPRPLPNDAPPAAVGDDRPLVASLKGLVFVDDVAKVLKENADVEGIHINGTGNLQLLHSRAFQEIARSYLGGPVSIRRLNELAREIIIFYRNNNMPVVDVSIPANQEITHGTVQVVVTEARVGKVRVEGACYFNPCVLLRQLCISPGDKIYESQLLSDQRWLYRDPFRTVDLELTPGKTPGETDVIFKIKDPKRPVRLYTGYEDTGNEALGLERTFYGINWYNAFDRDDDFGYQYTASSDFSSLGAHSAFYSHAMQNRDILTMYASYADYSTGLNNAILNSGHSWQVLSRWYRELCPRRCYQHGITGGFDVKNTDTNLDFGGANIFASSAQINQFYLGYKGGAQDRWGSWGLGADAYYSPGNIGGGNTDERFQVIRPGATANYFYSRGFFERRFTLPRCFEFVARTTGQISEANLLPTEQLGFGGYNSIRGYNLYSLAADSGYFANLEIWTPSMSLYRNDELRFLAFYDFGDAWNHSVPPGGFSHVDMQGVGTGLRYNIRDRMTLRADYGFPLETIPTYNAQNRWHVGLVFYY